MTSKYSSLPDIDDQPDVYETPDADENAPVISYENQKQSSDEDENVIKSHVSVKDAANKFKESVVDATDIDFSDRLTRRKKAMYRTFVRRPPAMETNEYEMLPKDMTLEETPLQKLRRLMFEVQELNDDIEKSKESVDEKEVISQSDILSQIVYLQSDLVRMNQQIGDADEDQRSNYTRSIDEAKSLIKQLEAYKNKPIKPEAPPTSDAAVVPESKADMVTYELYYTPEMSKMQKESKLSDIDERIARIEKLIGSSAGQTVEDLPASLSSSSLINSLSKLEQQIVLLAQPRQLEMVARRVKVLNSDLDRLNELKAGRKDISNTLGFSLSSTLNNPANAPGNDNKDDSNDTEAKINQLFATLEKVDPLLNLTPALLTRLKALQTLHAEAATFGQSVKVISEEQTRMTDELKSLTDTCAQLNESLKVNEEAVDTNIKIIDTRMTDLIQRISALSSTPSAE
ncbi:hypothetical protein G6F57_001434 [Rhizopus arrhizus]|uniref:Dynactin subunit 2 n=1 Tax=Rhizopus oryzae TaxID=64495 RepID=A0A9P6XL27_RHIOR|nr:hypothetical protein G6F23_000059 [Rhizopus arrhizus]KAG1416468.1 hypothetical protein G6F58_005960 [Rhizopus delemar]KAG0770041.1 hypothetical protein G6F24_000579 [Rhizopus arrhizus]KAG0797834.1 hypothetical protein G6F21_000228 [Rhizopus arrhizus]KAG0801886.1 hypothetical protein G6F22_000805 [Rhizopus arrhizus]